MYIRLFSFCCLLFSCMESAAQDTFSILAFDSITGEVGAAGASCIDLFASGEKADFIVQLFPGEGAVVTQANYIKANQENAAKRFAADDSPTQLIKWLSSNDALSSPDVRQYGVVRMNKGFPKTAAFTGFLTLNFKGHITGPNYCIQGNILKGRMVLDSMEAQFNREKGDLACKLMAALQGANSVGADVRCASNVSSSLFAFLEVAAPDDAFDKPSFQVAVSTHPNALIEPVDSLRSLFREARASSACTAHHSPSRAFSLFPNPATDWLVITAGSDSEWSTCVVRDAFGRMVLETEFRRGLKLHTGDWSRGLYFMEISTGGTTYYRKVVLNHD